ncbi:MAG TPA: hypothetical protein VIX17_26285 [Pyrinomonadaceae bacterium]
MDWKYKHFHQERTFEAPQDLVAEAARKYFVESLGWQITQAAEGFNAEGYGFSHKCIARLQFPSDANATKVVIDLAVNRAGGRGFMLFDVGGYYNIQMRHWLDGTQANLHTVLTPQSISSPNPVPPPPPSTNKGAACLFNGCIGFIVAMVALYVLVTFSEATIGLITGHLYLFGRGGTLVVEGIAGRLISALIIMFILSIAWRVKKVSLSKR